MGEVKGKILLSDVKVVGGARQTGSTPMAELVFAKVDGYPRYEFENVPIVGGMANVYKAFDRKFGINVALKVVKPSFLDKRGNAFTEIEARRLALLRHPNIVGVFDLIEGKVDTDDVRFIMVMEWLDPSKYRTLKVMENGGLMDLEKIIKITREVASALDYLNEEHVMHRDVKPENILVDESIDVKLIDFGISETSPFFKDNFDEMLGTAAYMSPEEVRESEIDTRSDVFSLGCVVYEMIAGFNPYLKESNEKPMDVILRRFNGYPSLKDRECGRGKLLLEAVDGVLEKSLKVKVEERYQTAGEFALALKAALEPFIKK